MSGAGDLIMLLGVFAGKRAEPSTTVLGLAKPVVPVLMEALRNPDRGVRANAAFILGTTGLGMGPDAAVAVPSLAEALKDPDAVVRASAAGALRMIGREAGDAIPALTAALKDNDKKVRDAASKALKSIQRDQKRKP